MQIKRKDFQVDYTNSNFLRVNFRARTPCKAKVRCFCGVKIRDEIWTDIYYFKDSDNWVIQNKNNDLKFSFKKYSHED